MAAQVVQEAAGGGDGVGAAAEGLRGGAGRGPGQAGHDRGGVDHRVAGFLDDAAAGREVRAESARGGGLPGSAVAPAAAVTSSSSPHSAGASPSYAISRSRLPVSASTIASAG